MLLACSQPEYANEDQRPPELQSALNVCGHQGGKGKGVPLTQQRVPTACSQWLEGDSPTRQRNHQGCIQGMEEVGGLPTQQRALPLNGQGREGGTPTRQRATLAHN